MQRFNAILKARGTLQCAFRLVRRTTQVLGQSPAPRLEKRPKIQLALVIEIFVNNLTLDYLETGTEGIFKIS